MEDPFGKMARLINEDIITDFYSSAKYLICPSGLKTVISYGDRAGVD